MADRRITTFRALLSITAGAMMLRSLMFLEEEEEEEAGGEPGSFRQSTDSDLERIPESVRPVVREVESRISAVSRSAGRRIRRHQIGLVSSTALAGAVPVAAAAHGPAWLMAAFGAGAAFAQVVPQITQDHRIGVEQHLLAVRMSSALRRFRLEILEGLEHEELRARTRNLIQEIEDLDDGSTTRITEAMLGAPANTNNRAT